MGARRFLFFFSFAITLFAASAEANEANYYRFWQGFKRADLSQNQFLGFLPDFMQGISVYTNRGINQYLVAVPPENRPAFLPDEFALIAIDSEASYRTVRATPEGIAYGDSHWALFDQAKSKSADMKMGSELLTSRLQWSTAYNMLGNPVDLSTGHTAFFIGLRKATVAPNEFREKMQKHVVEVAASLNPLGLTGYLILATEDYEVAYMHWESEAAADAAFKLPAGIAAGAGAAEIMDFLYFGGVQKFDGANISSGAFYKFY